ncbi:MAG TPA: hypothetical protein VGL99_16570 [Chloroflexota bacterium]|jgi:hypothetical protein
MVVDHADAQAKREAAAKILAASNPDAAFDILMGIGNIVKPPAPKARTQHSNGVQAFSAAITGDEPNGSDRGAEGNGSAFAADPVMQWLLGYWKSRQAQADRPTNGSAIVSRPLQIDDFQSFILAEAPYGVTAIKDVQSWVTYDGPHLPDNVVVPDRALRPPLYWYFDGQAYRIVRALTFDYTYTTRSPSGDYVTQVDSIYVGFEGRYDKNSGTYEPGPLAGREKRNPMDFKVADSISVPLAIESNDHKVRDVLETELKGLGFVFPNWQSGWVDYAGPARNATSFEPYTVTIAELVERREEFNRLLFWPVGGSMKRVAKAMRIQCLDYFPDADAEKPMCLRSILIGFKGAGGTGPG